MADQHTAGYGDYRDRIARLVQNAGSNEDAQTKLLAELTREVHAVKWIIAWVLILVPLIVLILGIVIDMALNKSTPPTSYGGY